jgi:hypothetical protein
MSERNGFMRAKRGSLAKTSAAACAGHWTWPAGGGERLGEGDGVALAVGAGGVADGAVGATELPGAAQATSKPTSIAAMMATFCDDPSMHVTTPTLRRWFREPANSINFVP